MTEMMHSEDQHTLDRPACLLIAINACFSISLALSNIFVNVYLFKIENNFTTIGVFNLFQYLFIAITFIIAGMLVKRWSSTGSLRIGVMLLAAFFLSVLLLGDKSNSYIPWLGMLIGVGNGFYWLSYNVLYFEITGPGNRDHYNGTDGLFSSLANVVAPLLSGWLITTMADEKGYRLIFSISLGIFVIAAIVSFFLPRRPPEGRYFLKEVWKETRQRTKWHFAMLAMIGQGFPDAIFAFLIGLLVYFVTKSEWRLGIFGFVTAGIALVSYYLVGKMMRRSWRGISVFIGALMISVVIIPSLVSTNFWTMLLFGIGMSLFAPFFVIPLTSTVFDLIGASKRSAQLRVEHVVIREMALSVGRLFGIISFIVLVQFTQKPGHLLTFILVLSFVQLFSWSAMRKIFA